MVDGHPVYVYDETTNDNVDTTSILNNTSIPSESDSTNTEKRILLQLMRIDKYLKEVESLSVVHLLKKLLLVSVFWLMIGRLNHLILLKSVI